MFGLSMAEIILIVVIALIVIGPKKLPNIAKSLGKGYGEFRRTFSDLKQSVDPNAPMNTPANNTNNSGQQGETPDYTQQFRSQWEQKFTPTEEAPAAPAKTESKFNVASASSAPKTAEAEDKSKSSN